MIISYIVEDATIRSTVLNYMYQHVINYIYQHLDKQREYVRALLIDFSSAFNTIISAILIEKLTNLGVDPYICAWIKNFLTDRH